MHLLSESTPARARLLDGLLPLRHAAVGARHALPQPVWMARYLVREASSRLRILSSQHEAALGAGLHADIGRQMLADFETWCSMPAGCGPWPRSEALDTAQVEAFERELRLLALDEPSPLARQLLRVADAAGQRAAALARTEGVQMGRRAA